MALVGSAAAVVLLLFVLGSLGAASWAWRVEWRRNDRASLLRVKRCYLLACAGQILMAVLLGDDAWLGGALYVLTAVFAGAGHGRVRVRLGLLDLVEQRTGRRF